MDSPGWRYEKRREHVVPLPRQAVELFEELLKLNGAYPLLFLAAVIRPSLDPIPCS